MTKSNIFLYFCLSFIGGIFLNSFLNIPIVLMLGIFILGILFASVLWKYKKFTIVGFCLIFLAAGIYRHQQIESGIKNNELRKYNDLEQEITLIGRISGEPDVRASNAKLTIKINNYRVAPLRSRNIKGKILVTTGLYPKYQYGDELKITGKLKTPHIFEDFNYKEYLAKQGIYSTMYYPQIQPLGKNYREQFSAISGSTSIIYAKILRFKNKLRDTIYQNLSPPYSSILGAMILGDKSRMSEELKEKLNIVGIRHITCVSGMHIVILTAILMSFFIGLGLWRQQAFYFTIIFIWLFIVMTGFQATGIRAGIMGSLLLLAQYLGRINVSSRAIVFAAALMLFCNPLLLKSDIGFQLSFLAVMGIIYLMPIFQQWLKWIPIKSIKDIISMTLAAQVFTLPILIYNFGYMSLIAPISNVLIVPLIPFIMVSGFIFGIAGILWQPLGWLLSLPCWLLLAYVIKIVDWFSGFSLACLNLEISWIWLVISYLILGYFAWRLNRNQKLKFLD